jgi:hypothetical protein
MPAAIALFILIIVSAPDAQLDARALKHGLCGGSVVANPTHNCVPDEQRRLIAEIARQNELLYAAPAPRGIIPLFEFFPIGGNGNKDTFHGGFVDLDPTSPGFHDYNCTPFTYNGHAGCDTEIRSFGEQVIGVPVFAALDGVVVFAQDGYPDMNVSGGVQGNIVGIDHGGRVTWYYHLKNGSVAVSVSQVVKAGQQIGKVGSSGNSFGPHLHFEVLDGSVVYEPFAGPCRAGPSGFINQPPMNLDSFLEDFATTYEDIAAYPGLPFEMPRSGQIALTDSHVRFWLRGHNLPVGSDWRVRFYRPDNSLALEAAWFFFNTEIYRNYWFPWEFDNIPDMHTITGTWRVVVDFNNVIMVDAPYEVRTARTPEFNRAPQPITVAFDPPAPTANHTIFCRVNTSLTLDDLDYDIVRYHYVWTIDGTVVRDVISAGQADAIPRNSGCPGAVLQCTVTPNDGKVDGTPVIANFTLPGVANIDLNCDCVLTPADIPNFIQALLNSAAFTGCSINRADANDDGQINGRDIRAFALAMLGP